MPAAHGRRRPGPAGVGNTRCGKGLVSRAARRAAAGHAFGDGTVLDDWDVKRAVAVGVILASAAGGAAWWLGRGPSVDELGARAQQHLDGGRPVEAALDARSAVALEPESAALRLLLARALWSVGDVAGAAAEADRAERLGADPAAVRVLQAQTLLARQQAHQAIELLRTAPASAASAQAALSALRAEALLALGDREAAASAIADALRAEPDHLPAQLLRARMSAAGGDAAGALAAQQALEAKWPRDAAVRTLRGDLLAAGAELPAAAAAYREALALDARSDAAHLGLVMVLLRQRQLDEAATQVAALRQVMPQLPVVDYLDALTAYLANRPEQAAERIERALARAEPNAAVLQLAGLVQSRLGQAARAESLLSGALALAPKLVDARHELAMLQLRAGRPERALSVLEPALEPAQADAALWQAAGQAYAQLGRFRQADEAFARASKARPDDPALRREIARSLIARGQLDAGVRGLQAAAAADGQGIVADLALVSTLMRRGDWAAATRALDAAAAKQPTAALPWLMRGVIAETRGDLPAARRAYEDALRREAGSLRAVWALTGLDIREARLDDARARLQAALKTHPRSAPLRLGLADLALRSGQTQKGVAELIDASVQADPLDGANWLQALELQRRLGDPAALLVRAQAAHAAVPDDARLMLELAGAQLGAGETEQALGTLRRLVQMRPTMPEAHLRLAVVLGLKGLTSEARAPMERALALAPDSPTVLRGGIALALAERQGDRALALARSLQKRAPTLPGGWQLEAEVQQSLADRKAAQAAWRTALDKGATGEAAVQLHRLLLADDPAAAEAMARQWRASQPRDAFFVTHLAETAAQAGQRAQAEAHYRQALALVPDHVGVLNNLADLLVGVRPQEALALAVRAATLAPAEAAVLDTLAAAQAASGQLAAALSTQQRAVAFAPGDPRLRLHLGRLWLDSGDKDKAREQLRRAEQAADPAVREAAGALLRQAG
jgi:putative PEP-CTERM system TPR-repeat lipoprotein